jgi:hypothetical protein
MTNVLPFPARMQSGGNQAAKAPSASLKAEILLFTGVRYERHAGTDPQNAAPDTLGRDDGTGPRRRKTRRRA